MWHVKAEHHFHVTRPLSAFLSAPHWDQSPDARTWLSCPYQDLRDGTASNMVEDRADFRESGAPFHPHCLGADLHPTERPPVRHSGKPHPLHRAPFGQTSRATVAPREISLHPVTSEPADTGLARRYMDLSAFRYACPCQQLIDSLMTSQSPGIDRCALFIIRQYRCVCLTINWHR
jgi:hypothetical protein